MKERSRRNVYLRCPRCQTVQEEIRYGSFCPECGYSWVLHCPACDFAFPFPMTMCPLCGLVSEESFVSLGFTPPRLDIVERCMCAEERTLLGEVLAKVHCAGLHEALPCDSSTGRLPLDECAPTAVRRFQEMLEGIGAVSVGLLFLASRDPGVPRHAPFEWEWRVDSDGDGPVFVHVLSWRLVELLDPPELAALLLARAYPLLAGTVPLVSRLLAADATEAEHPILMRWFESMLRSAWSCSLACSSMEGWTALEAASALLKDLLSNSGGTLSVLPRLLRLLREEVPVSSGGNLLVSALGEKGAHLFLEVWGVSSVRCQPLLRRGRLSSVSSAEPPPVVTVSAGRPASDMPLEGGRHGAFAPHEVVLEFRPPAAESADAAGRAPDFSVSPPVSEPLLAAGEYLMLLVPEVSSLLFYDAGLEKAAERPIGTSLVHPRRLCPGGDAQCVWLSDFEASRVVGTGDDGRPVTVIGGKGRAPGRLLHPLGVALDGDGALWVCDCWNDRVQRFSVRDGRLLLESKGEREGRTFSRPSGCCWDSARGLLWVCDRGNGALVALDAGGLVVRELRGFDAPMDVEVCDGVAGLQDVLLVTCEYSVELVRSSDGDRLRTAVHRSAPLEWCVLTGAGHLLYARRHERVVRSCRDFPSLSSGSLDGEEAECAREELLLSAPVSCGILMRR